MGRNTTLFETTVLFGAACDSLRHCWDFFRPRTQVPADSWSAWLLKDDLWFSSGSLESSTEGYSSAHKGRWVHGEAAVVSHPEKSLQHYQRHPGTVRAERGDGGAQPCTSTSHSPLACACSFCETNSEVVFEQKNRAGHEKNGLHNRGRGVPANTADTQPRPQLQKRSWELPCPPRSASKKSAQLSLETRFAKEKYFF